jgi:membrane fusion protein, copper/silver efflux system
MKREAWVMAGAVAISFLFGYLIRAITGPTGATATTAETAKDAVWTCSMHPQIRMPKPGKCPICGMPLVPARGAESGGAAAGSLALSEAARALARVETHPVERRRIANEIRAVGKIQFNESALATVTARVDGYVERLFADFTGMEVAKGDHLVELYSPELVVAQREYLLALDEPANAGRLEAARLKLRRWDVAEAQIAELEKSKRVLERLTIHSTVGGTVVEKNVVEKSPVKAGDVLYRVADLRSLWVHLSLYEYEIAWAQIGQAVSLTVEAFPGETFRGRVTFVSPVLDEDTRSVRVRVNVSNLDRRLKPGMFASARIEVGLLADGRPAPPGIEGKYSCPMHPEVLADAPGACPLCGMALKRIPGSPRAPAPDVVLAVPASAVLDSGTRRLVYLERGPGEFLPAEVTLGPKSGEYFPVVSGLKEGDRVVVRGNFLLDSQFQIQGLPSLLHPKGSAPPAAHEGHGAPKPAPAQEGHKH